MSVISDLTIEYGFSMANAKKAVAMYEAGELSDKEKKVMDFLVERNKKNFLLPEALLGNSHLDKLNYRISQETN